MGLREFVWLSNRSTTAFWELMRGGSPNETAERRNQYQRALAAYGRTCSPNGIDDVQLRALEHIRTMDVRLWTAFLKRNRSKYKTKGLARRDFEAWLRSTAY